MGTTQRDVRWSFVTADHDHWTSEHKDEFYAQEETGLQDYSDWVYDKITEVMENAGHEFMAQNPDLFTGELI
jgi:hypothetical protein